MTDRRARIVRLLETRDDHLQEAGPRPLSSLGFVHRAPARESCPDCLANGFVSFDCATCRGRGYLEVRRTKDPYDTGLASGWFGSSSERHEAGRERDREIARLEAQTLPPEPESAQLEHTRPEAWETARARAFAQFDYRALDVALDDLRLVDGSAYHVLHVRHVYGQRLARALGAHLEAVTLSAGESVVLERGLRFLDARLPDPLRAPPASKPPEPPAVESGSRDREIRRLLRDGAAAQWVAQRFGLSVSQVYRIVRNDHERRTA